MSTLRTASIAGLCLALTAGAAILTARGQYSRPGEIGENHVVVDNRVLIWGQDRLELVMRALGGWRPVHG